MRRCKIVTAAERNAHQTGTRFKDSTELVFVEAEKACYALYLKKLLPPVHPGRATLARSTGPGGQRMANAGPSVAHHQWSASGDDVIARVRT